MMPVVVADDGMRLAVPQAPMVADVFSSLCLKPHVTR
ncbi:hypothetical protein M2281_004185 [Mesorhizobium soli]|jgi:hypothetical protein|nr:hypothetical protein [Mesorhizobium soli]